LDPARFHQLKTLLILDDRIRAFAKRHRIVVPASDLRLAMRRAWSSLKRQFQKSAEGNFEAFCQRSFGLSAEKLRSQIRLAEARRLLRSYALRFRLRRVGSVTMDFVWSSKKDLLDRFHKRIQGGASFDPLLRSLFREDPRAKGGHLPPIPLDAKHRALQIAKTWKGVGIQAPQPMPGPGGEPGFAWIRVLARSPGDPRTFDQMWPDLQNDLARSPVGAGELELFLPDGYDGGRDG
jgi:hypothetical protein